MAAFIFDEESHTYWLDGVQLPSVTQVINDLYNFDGIPAHRLKLKAELGTEFHSIIKLYLLDDLIVDSIDKRLVKPFNSFVTWSESRLDQFKKGMMELRMFNYRKQLAGTCDLALPLDLYDWKLRFYNPVVDILQLQGYDMLLGGKKRRRWTICFDLYGGFTQNRSEHSQAKDMFNYMLHYWHSDKSKEQEYLNVLESWKGQFN